jgi:hypothetical protein
VLVRDARTRSVDVAARDVATNGVSEWTRSPACTEEDCIAFDRVIVRDRAVGEPLRLLGSTTGLGTWGADLGFRCAR